MTGFGRRGETERGEEVCLYVVDGWARGAVVSSAGVLVRILSRDSPTLVLASP